MITKLKPKSRGNLIYSGDEVDNARAEWEKRLSSSHPSIINQNTTFAT